MLFDYNDTHDEDCVAVAMATLSSPSDPIRLGIDVMHVALPQGIPALADFKETLEDMVSEGGMAHMSIANVNLRLHLLNGRA